MLLRGTNLMKVSNVRQYLPLKYILYFEKTKYIGWFELRSREAAQHPRLMALQFSLNGVKMERLYLSKTHSTGFKTM